MKITLALVALLGLLGCGHSGNSSSNNNSQSSGNLNACMSNPILGTFEGLANGQTDIINIYGDCTITSTYCNYSATFQPTTLSSGNVTVTITSADKKTGCLPVGQTTCSYNVNNNYMIFSCGGAAVIYLRTG